MRRPLPPRVCRPRSVDAVCATLVGRAASRHQPLRCRGARSGHAATRRAVARPARSSYMHSHHYAPRDAEGQAVVHHYLVVLIEDMRRLHEMRAY